MRHVLLAACAICWLSAVAPVAVAQETLACSDTLESLNSVLAVLDTFATPTGDRIRIPICGGTRVDASVGSLVIPAREGFTIVIHCEDGSDEECVIQGSPAFSPQMWLSGSVLFENVKFNQFTTSLFALADEAETANVEFERCAIKVRHGAAVLLWCCCGAVHCFTDVSVC